MVCVKALLLALFLPCATASSEPPREEAKPCAKAAAQSLREPRWEPGRGFLYARY